MQQEPTKHPAIEHLTAAAMLLHVGDEEGAQRALSKAADKMGAICMPAYDMQADAARYGMATFKTPGILVDPDKFV